MLAFNLAEIDTPDNRIDATIEYLGGKCNACPNDDGPFELMNEDRITLYDALCMPYDEFWDVLDTSALVCVACYARLTDGE